MMTKPTPTPFLFPFLLCLIILLFHGFHPVLAELPPDCSASCGVVDYLQACKSGDIECTCAPHAISDADACLSCLTDSGIDVSVVQGFESLTDVGRLCEGREVVNAGSKPQPSSGTSQSSSGNAHGAPRAITWAFTGLLSVTTLSLTVY